MVIDYCTLNIQSCMIHFCVRSNILIKMMYHKYIFVKFTMIYDHICTQVFQPILLVRLQSYQIFSNVEKVKYIFSTYIKVAFFDIKSQIAFYVQILTLHYGKQIANSKTDQILSLVSLIFCKTSVKSTLSLKIIV